MVFLAQIAEQCGRLANAIGKGYSFGGLVMFQCLLRVRFLECDPQGVVFNGRYVDYVDVVMTEYFRAVIGDYAVFQSMGLELVVVNINVDWKASASADQVLAVAVENKSLGNSSMTFKVLFANAESSTAIAEASVTYVAVDSKTFSKCPVPEVLKDKFVSELGDYRVDLSGVHTHA